MGWKANLISEPFSDNSDGCIYFWYHMFGVNIGSLNVYLVAGNQKTLLWTLSGQYGKFILLTYCIIPNKVLSNC
jgi:hypothetical protein